MAGVSKYSMESDSIKAKSQNIKHQQLAFKQLNKSTVSDANIRTRPDFAFGLRIVWFLDTLYKPRPFI